ncbi:MAG: YggT family protein [Propionibacteriaceae bacterium]|nr:YggT family protein [Propionibacteriaceae bacterium]
MLTIGWLLFGILTIYQWILIARAIFSWIPMIIPSWSPRGLVMVVAEVVFTLTDPPLRFLRKFMKPLRIAGMGLDMAFLVLFLLIMIGLHLVRVGFFS